MSTTVTVRQPETTIPRPGSRLLQLALIMDALTFLTAAALNFGAHIPLGVVMLQFPFHGMRAGEGEAIIGAALLIGGLSMRRSLAWIGLWLSASGVAFGLVATARSGGPSFDVHMVMLAFGLCVIGLLLWTARGAEATPRQNASAMSRIDAGLKATGGLMLLAGFTLLGASVIHFGLTAPLVADPFAAAAIPEGVLGMIMLLGGVLRLSARNGSWEAAVAMTVLTILLTIYGFTVTLKSGRVGDIAYHVTLLAMLFGNLGLLLSPVRRRGRDR